VEAFNSLSRDHEFTPATFGTEPVYYLSTPSLGITGAHEAAGREDGRADRPFNSLSRDHNLSFRPNTIGPKCNLSTPSLGITRENIPWSGLRRIFAFNSLSRDHALGLHRMDQLPERTFNSLSRDHRKGQKLLNRLMILSTPSLGITVKCGADDAPDCVGDLSTPSLGIT